MGSSQRATFRGLDGDRETGVSRNGSAELTYALHPKFWRQGWALRMSHTLLGACFRRGVINQIWAGADLPNIRSIEVMKRLGMSFKGSVTYPAGEGIEYVILRDDYDLGGIDTLPMQSSGGEGLSQCNTATPETASP